MSLFNWIWDFDQDSKIQEQNDELKKLRSEVETLKDWIQYLNTKVESLERKE